MGHIPQYIPTVLPGIIGVAPKAGVEIHSTPLLQQYVALDRGYTCCVSENHSKRIDMGMLVKGSFQGPSTGQTQ